MTSATYKYMITVTFVMAVVAHGQAVVDGWLLPGIENGSCAEEHEETSLIQTKTVVARSTERSGKAVQISDTATDWDVSQNVSTSTERSVKISDKAVKISNSSKAHDWDELIDKISDNISDKATDKVTGKATDYVLHNESTSYWDEFIDKSTVFFKYPLKEEEQKFCWRGSKVRGTGKIPKTCPDGYGRPAVLSGIFPACYKTCADVNAAGDEDGMKSFGYDCVSKCPEGWRDDGLFCRQAEYGRGWGHISEALCEQAESTAGVMTRQTGIKTCEKWGAHSQAFGLSLALWYPQCASGYKSYGCCICVPQDFDQKMCTDNFGPKSFIVAGSSCKKEIEHSSLAPHHMGCEDPTPDADGGLCYKKCEVGEGVGPVCWFKAPKDWVECGMGAAISKGECVKVLADQIFATVAMALKLATFGAAHAATEAGSEAAQLAAEHTAQSMEESKAWYERAEAGADSLVATAAAVSDKEWGEFAFIAENAAVGVATVATSAVVAGTVGSKALEGLNNIVTGETVEDQIRGAAQIATRWDPTGVAGVIGAYTYPICGEDGQKPKSMAPKYQEKLTAVQEKRIEALAALAAKIKGQLASDDLHCYCGSSSDATACAIKGIATASAPIYKAIEKLCCKLSKIDDPAKFGTEKAPDFCFTRAWPSFSQVSLPASEVKGELRIQSALLPVKRVTFYKIKVVPQAPFGMWCVSRRYSDFNKLKDRLTDAVANTKGFPQKGFFIGAKGMEQRRAKLEEWINKVLAATSARSSHMAAMNYAIDLFLEVAQQQELSLVLNKGTAVSVDTEFDADKGGDSKPITLKKGGSGVVRDMECDGALIDFKGKGGGSVGQFVKKENFGNLKIKTSATYNDQEEPARRL